MHDGMDYEETEKPSGANLNTIMLAVVLGVLGFIGHTSFETAKRVEGLSAAQLSRPEVDAKIEQVRAEYIGIRTELATLKAQMISIETRLKP